MVVTAFVRRESTQNYPQQTSRRKIALGAVNNKIGLVNKILSGWVDASQVGVPKEMSTFSIDRQKARHKLWLAGGTV